MKLNRQKIIQMNRAQMSKYIPGYSTQDTINTVVTKVGDQIRLSVPDDTEVDRATITFTTRMIVAVSKGEPSLETVRRTLASIATTTVMAGTGVGSAPLVMNGVNIAGDVTRGLSALYDAPSKPAIIPFTVPFLVTGPNRSYDIRCVAYGSTVTTDDDSDEVAQISSALRFQNRDPSRDAELKNIGKQEPLLYELDMRIDGAESVGFSETSCTLLARVRTDGAVTHDTISAVQVEYVEFSIRETTTSRTVTPDGSGGPTDGGGQPGEGSEPSTPGDAGGSGGNESEERSNRARTSGFDRSDVRFLQEVGDVTSEQLAAAGIVDMATLAAAGGRRVLGIGVLRMAHLVAMANVVEELPVGSNEAEFLVKGLGVRTVGDLREIDTSEERVTLALERVKLPEGFDVTALMEKLRS